MPIDRNARLAPLLRWPFLLALGLLILNDAALKAAWHNAFTGKLSDFAGVFAFAYFWAATIGRARTAVHVVVAAVFVWWKSSWSAPAIDAWNALPLFEVARVVDYGDLFALVVLPLSWWSLARSPKPDSRPDATTAWPQLAVAAIALVAFTATSRAPTTVKVEGGVMYLAPMSPEAMLLRTSEYSHDAGSDPALYPLVFSWSDCEVMAEFELQSTGNATLMALRSFTSDRCDVRKAKLTELFLAMQPKLRARLEARLLKPYSIPGDAVFAETSLEDASNDTPPRCAENAQPSPSDSQNAEALEPDRNL